MATTIRSLSDTSADSGRYQPMSLFSVLAIVAAGLYTVLVLILTVVGLYTRKPVLELWLVLFAGVGIITAIAARWQISNSEGTLAGRKMANWALVISILVGCVYVAYYAGNILAIRNQANSFVQDKWLKALQDRKFDEAYFYGMPPADRQGVRQSTVATRFSLPVQVFRHTYLSTIFDEARGEVAIESLGIRDLNATPEGYVATLQYRVKTRMGEFDLAVGTLGAEGKDIKGREWAVSRGATSIQKFTLSTYGRMVNEIRADAETAVGEWVSSRINTGYPSDAQARLEVLPLTRVQREERYREYVTRTALREILPAGSIPAGGLATAALLGAHLGDTPLNRQIAMPDAEAAWSKLVSIDTSKQDVSPVESQEILARTLRLGTIRLKTEGYEVASKLDLKKDSLQVVKEVLLNYPGPIGGTLRGEIVVGCLDRNLVARLNELKSAPWNPDAPLQIDASQSLLRNYRADWYIVQIIVHVEKAQSRDSGTVPPERMRMEMRPNRPGQ